MGAPKTISGVLRFCAAVAFVVAPGALAALETVLNAPGAPEPLQQRLTSASQVMTAEVFGLTTSQELLAAALSDYRTLVAILYEAGYFSPGVQIRIDGREATDISPLDPPAQVNKIEINVQTGRQFVFGRAEITPLAPGTTVPKGYAVGQPASTAAIRDAARAGVTGWRHAGYAKAEVAEQSVIARHTQGELDARLRLQPGRQLRFGTLVQRGDSAVRPDAIARIAGFPTGEVFDPDTLDTVGNRLRRTGAFSSVSLREREKANADDTLDVVATMVDQKPRRISFGGEIQSEQGINLSFLWTHRNLFGGAERFTFDARLRNIGGTQNLDGLFSLRLDKPAALGPDYDAFYLIQLEALEEPHYNAVRLLAGGGVRRIYSENLFAELALTLSRTTADDAYGSDRKFNLVSLPARVEWDRRDNKISANDGFFLDARLIPFAGLSGSDSGARILLDGRGYFGLGADNRVVLAGRVQIGSVMGASQSGTTPEYLFFSGGAGTVRGQPYLSLGTPVGTGIAGGRSLLAGSFEVRGRVTEKISLVGFYDAAIVGSDSFINDASPRHSGAGLGLRYDLGGLGPIRLDLALPVSGSTGDGLQFYLGIGQAF